MPEGHDQLFRDLIAAFPGDFVRLMLPEVTTGLDLDAVDFQREEYFTDSPRAGRPRRPDLAARASTLAGGEVGFHVEIEARYRTDRVAKLFDYNRLLSLRLALPVHTMVVYCRGGPPGVQPRELREESLGRTITIFRYVSLGLSQAPAAKFLASPYPLAWALAALARPGKIRSRAELRVACLEKIASLKRLTEHQRFLLFNFVATYIESDRGRNHRISEEYDELLQRNAFQEVRREMMTWAEKMEAKGFTQGHQAGRRAGWEEGRKEGRKEGQKEGQAALLMRLVESKFGPLEPPTRQRIENATPEDLQVWGERFVTAGSLDEVFEAK